MNDGFLAAEGRIKLAEEFFRNHFSRCRQVPGKLWEGHDFSRAVVFLKTSRASAPAVRFRQQRLVFRQPAKKNRDSARRPSNARL